MVIQQKLFGLKSALLYLIHILMQMCMRVHVILLCCRMGPVDGRRDEGVGSNWSGVCHRPLELPPHAALLEGVADL